MYAYEYDHVKVTYACTPVPADEEFGRFHAELDDLRREQSAQPPAEKDAAGGGEGQ